MDLELIGLRLDLPVCHLPTSLVAQNIYKIRPCCDRPHQIQSLLTIGVTTGPNSTHTSSAKWVPADFSITL